MIGAHTERESLIASRATQLYDEHRHRIYQRTDRIFAILMGVQWLSGIATAVFVSPYTWEGRTASVHIHVYAAVFLGFAISSLPIALAALRPGTALTRHAMAFAQMLWSAMFIHLSGGRIEAHFHVFGSLAFLAFYRDVRVLLTATVVVAADHFLRQIFWPESVFGIVNPEQWRFLEHAFWVVFEDAFIVVGIRQNIDEMKQMARQRADLEDLSKVERAKSTALDASLEELKRSQEIAVRAERLAAVGQLAASVGHELRNPLAAVRNAFTYLNRRIRDPKPGGEALQTDQRVGKFLSVVEQELDACSKIISDLLDFAHERTPSRSPCPLRTLVQDAISVVPGRANVKLVNAVSEKMPVPSLDKDQFRQVLVNLIQNAVEAMTERPDGRVTVEANGGGASPWRIAVTDNGGGIPEDVLPNVFQPLFTTKPKGTGLGLAIVWNIVKRHGGTITVDSDPEAGTSFTIELAGDSMSRAA